MNSEVLVSLSENQARQTVVRVTEDGLVGFMSRRVQKRVQGVCFTLKRTAAVRKRANTTHIS